MSPIHRRVDGHPGNTEDCPAMTWASVGGGATTTDGPTPLSRSDPVLRFVLPRQRFVRWSQAPLRMGPLPLLEVARTQCNANAKLTTSPRAIAPRSRRRL